jgi:hypothetical protein
MSDQKFTTEVEVKGAEKGAKDLEGVAKAEAKLEQQTEQVAVGADQAAESTRKMATSQSDLVTLLTQVNPRLGQFADGMLKASKLAGDLATRQISLTNLWEKGSRAVKLHAKSLMLVGAGSAALAGVVAIAKAVALMREEWEKATKAVRDYARASSAAETARAARKAELEKGAAGRGEGPPSAAEATQLSDRLEALMKALAGVVDPESAKKAVLLGGAGASNELLTKLAILIDRFPVAMDTDRVKGMRPDIRERYIEGRLGRFGEQIEKVIATERVQLRELIAKALAETRGEGGGTAAIQEWLKTLPGRGMEGVSGEKLSEIVAALRGITEGDITKASMGKGIWGADIFSEMFRELQMKAAALEKKGVEGATPELVRQAEGVLKMLERAAEKMSTESVVGGLEAAAAELRAAASALASAISNTAVAPGTTIINAQGSRFVGPSSRAQQAEMVNGRVRAERAEML